ncbi:MAG: hypothetical protein II670_02420 [Alphaproteobacteria bacterium]|nr:hypothetical protein [Alphaproteobacteria bacterium]
MDSQTIISAFTHILYQIVYYVFILPFEVWSKAIKRLAAQRENKSLKFVEIKSQWPMFTFLKRWLIDFLFDALIAIIWIILLYNFFKRFDFFVSIPFKDSFGTGMKSLFFSLLAIYTAPVSIHLLRDLFILLLKPITKLLGWLNKPAQHLDITIDKEVL